MAAERMRSLDIFRGITVALMIVVNTPGDWGAVYAPLLHAQWHGFTPTDLVFPTFLFIVGVSMRIAFRHADALRDAGAMNRIVRRAAIIFALGLLLNWFPFVHANDAGQWMIKPWSEVRIPGVLQRIAACFVCAAVVLRIGRERGAWLFCATALLGYRAMLDAWGDYSLAGNALRKLDLAVFGDAHLYHGEGIAFDPEGLLGTLPATVNVIAGWIAAGLVRKATAREDAPLRMLIAAGLLFVGVAIGWHASLPINKKLWTSSYALLTVGLDLLLFASLVWLVDRRGCDRWGRFFESFGRNALFIYLLSEAGVILLLEFHAGGRTAYGAIYEAILALVRDAHAASLAFALGAMLLCWCVAMLLDRRRIYVRI